MSAPDPVEELALLVRSSHGLAVFVVDDEDRAESLLRHLADRLGVPYFGWSRTRGLVRDGADGPVYDTQHPARALAHVQHAEFPAVYHFSGLATFLDDPTTAAALADAIRPYEGNDGILVLTGPAMELPEAVRPRAAVVRAAPPADADYHELLGRILRDVRGRQDVDVAIEPDELRRLYANLRGLTLLEAEKVLTRAIVEDGRLTAADIGAVLEHKRTIVEREGLLEYYPAEEAMADIAGMASLKRWLAKRRTIINQPDRAREFGLEFPRGLLLVGVPGAGKSLCAKAVATEWSLPLLKLDPAALYNKYVGETERNFRRAMETAERMAPVVLWIDEIEKAFAQAGGEDGGVSARTLGTFLSWLQERKGDVFVVATANAVERLPPELLRKGRFDEVFFVDLPDTAARRQIFRIHLRRRGQDPDAFDMEALAAATAGFSGAEIEQVIISALYSAFAVDGALDDDRLLAEVRATRPLSVVAAERIAALRAWADGR
ncbi:MAG: AAA family ATPase, partial [Gemmatimonadetes bacterium]|nr:AAA family ATPase [Gemmatimonadota bacterium]NIQ57174.1 AAA family ATPase [Gemmatimonadota bacterium]NIU77349.1 AAA family ATPase [Gammaproteobacteria bacterium]NIX46607.1 AAA family ATPase [Gemmatimonadota bacterium]NIY10931.1 AAA family ATPase [Gemmatimonadota bacterium]